MFFKLFVLLKVKEVVPQFQMASSLWKKSNYFLSFHCLLNFQTVVLRLVAFGFMICVWSSDYKTVFLEAVERNSFLKPLLIKFGNMMLSTASKKASCVSWCETDLHKEWNGLVQFAIIQDTGLQKTSSLMQGTALKNKSQHKLDMFKTPCYRQGRYSHKTE